MSNVRVGTCSWTDKTLIESGGFYPSPGMSAEERLRFYAGNFNTVEVDSTFYALPSERVIGLQMERTPEDFVFHYKAFGLLTRHKVDARRLPKAVKGLMPVKLAGLPRIGPDEMPADAVDLAWQMFDSALLPAESMGKLGVVLFQFPPYFTYGPAEKEYILSCRDRLEHYRLAIEFRHSSWLDPDHIEEVLEWLRDNKLIYVCVDEPQFSGRTVPPLAAVTSDISYIRMHGRNRDAWYKKGISAAERFAYDYPDDELEEWAGKIDLISPFTSEVYVMFNNCFRNFAVKNARRMSEVLSRQSRGL